MLLRQLDESRVRLTITVDERKLQAFAGETIAACLLRNGVTFTRLAPSGAKRSPYCLMGACFECTMTVDGRANVQTCLRLVEDGMTVERTRVP